MSTEQPQNHEDDRRAARLTAHGLGQTDPAEKAEVEAEMAASPQARKAVEAAAAIAAKLQEAARAAPQPERSAALRAAVERRLQELEASPVSPLPLGEGQGVRAEEKSSGLGGTGCSSASAGTTGRQAARATLQMKSVAPLRDRPRWRRRYWAVLLIAASLLIAAVPAYLFLAPKGGDGRRGLLALFDKSSSAGRAADRSPTKAAKPSARNPNFLASDVVPSESDASPAPPKSDAQGKPAPGDADYLQIQSTLRKTPFSLTTALGDLGFKGKSAQDVAGEKPPADSMTKAPGQHVETWKPSALVPNSSRLMVGDKEELPLRGMQVDVRVDGFRARVVLDLFYLNDRPQQLEGNFQLRLPAEASPYFFAFGRSVFQAPQLRPSESMFFKPEQVAQADTGPDEILALRRASWQEPKVARMVPKEKAALAYRETVRRRVDPALVEWSGAGVFQCRVFPLAPQSLHRVTIGYDVDLLRAGDDLELRLDLPEHAPACVVDFNIAARAEKEVSLDAPATRSADGQRLSYRLVNPAVRPIIVRLREPGTTMLTGSDGKTGSYFAARVAIPLPETALTPGPSPEKGEGRGGFAAGGDSSTAIFLVDTSLSAGPQFPLWSKLMRAVLENNRDQIKQFAVLFFNVETFWWQEKWVDNTPENVDALMQYADSLALEGATDLGRALAEAAAPKWLKKAGAAPEMFLLSDGAATWGEDRLAVLAATLKTANSGPLFAYQTGMAGGDPRVLAHLARETGGAVFAVVGEAEIVRASTAQRSRPWRLVSVEMAGGRDLLLAGRPQFVFPGQQLLLVGRCEPDLKQAEIVFTLQQGESQYSVRTKMDRVLSSELAARTYGQVAVGQLEDLAAAAEPVATAYARHFRVTGQTCSLLMLDTEQDYARFNIKPEEDDFVVKDRPAAAIVSKAVAKSMAALSDPKAAFLAWFGTLQQTSGVHFDLPASLGIALEGLPKESFTVAVPPLACKLRMRQDLPENLRQLWTAGGPQYETMAAESARRLQKYGPDDALRAMSSLVEERPGDAALARDLAFSAMEWGLPGQAYHLLRRAAAAQTFEPTAFYALAHCLEQMGRDDLAIVYYELACGGQWDPRFGDIHNTAQFDYCRFLRRLADGRIHGKLADYAQARLATLTAARVRDTADLVALIFWNTDGTDVDLHVTEPGGEECFYQHRQTASGGQLSQDVTTGYGPEIYVLPRAPAGSYAVRAQYYATDANRASTRTKVFALIYQGWGSKEERVTAKAVALVGRSEMHPLADIAIGAAGGDNLLPPK
jgi:hypothetical protein